MGGISSRPEKCRSNLSRRSQGLSTCWTAARLNSYAPEKLSTAASPMAGRRPVWKPNGAKPQPSQQVQGLPKISQGPDYGRTEIPSWARTDHGTGRKITAIERMPDQLSKSHRKTSRIAKWFIERVCCEKHGEYEQRKRILTSSIINLPSPPTRCRAAWKTN